MVCVCGGGGGVCSLSDKRRNPARGPHGSSSPAHFPKEGPSAAKTGPPCWRALTLHTAAAGLQDPGIHIYPRLGHELVPHEVGVVG